MKKYLIALGMSLFLANFATAHHAGIKIKADKVIVKQGSDHAKFALMKCMLMLKHHKNAEEAIEAKFEKIDKVCEKLTLEKEKCDKFKKFAAFKILKCYTMAKFFKEFFGKGDHDTGTTKEIDVSVMETPATNK